MYSSDKEKKAKMVSSIIHFISLATKAYWREYIPCSKRLRVQV